MIIEGAHMKFAGVVWDFQCGKHLFLTSPLQVIFQCCVAFVLPHRSHLEWVCLLCITPFVSHIVLDF